MKYIIINILLLISALQYSNAQQNDVDRSKQLHVGEVFPNVKAMPILNFETESVQLQDWKDKVVVLEFFDTYCATCIEGMPALAEVQQDMGDKLKVFLVTWQSKEVIEKFYQNNAFLKEKKIRLPTIVSDTLLLKYFPHQSVPHTVFLYQGKVQAVTYPDYVKKQFVDELYNNGLFQVPQKDDFKKEDVTGLKHSDDHVIGSVRLRAYQEDLVQKPGLTMVKDSISGLYRTYFNNVGILNAYKALYAYIDKPTFLLTDKRIVWKVKDPDRYYYREGSGGKQLWLSKYGICYERKGYEVEDLAEQAKLVMSDLNSFLGLNVYWDYRVRDCLVIRDIDMPITDRNNIEVGQKMENLSVMMFLIDYSGKYLPIVNESSYNGPLELGYYQNLTELNKQLRFYGVELMPDKRKIEMLIFEEV